MLRTRAGSWQRADMTVEELDDFVDIHDERERQELLREASRANAGEKRATGAG